MLTAMQCVVAPYRGDVGGAVGLRAPAPDAAQAEGVLAVQQPKAPLAGRTLLQHALQADAALHLPGGRMHLTGAKCSSGRDGRRLCSLAQLHQQHLPRQAVPRP